MSESLPTRADGKRLPAKCGLGAFTLLMECGAVDDIYNRIIVGLQGFTKRGKNIRPRLTAVRILLCSLERFNHDHTVHQNCV